MKDPLLSCPTCPPIPGERVAEEAFGSVGAWGSEPNGTAAFVWPDHETQTAVVLFVGPSGPPATAEDARRDAFRGTFEECAAYLWRLGCRSFATVGLLRTEAN